MDRVVGYIIGLILLLVGCSDDYGTKYSEKENFISYDLRLPKNENGDYYLNLNQEKWQTIHRVDGKVYGSDDLEYHQIHWKSNLYWVIGDTLGYVVKRKLSDDVVYVNYDTTYVTQFDGYEVRTTNNTSYTHEDGTFSNVIAPVKTMVGDTLRLTAIFDYQEKTFEIILR